MIWPMRLFDKVKAPGCCCVAIPLKHFVFFANLGLDFLLSCGNSCSYCSAGFSG